MAHTDHLFADVLRRFTGPAESAIDDLTEIEADLLADAGVPLLDCDTDPDEVVEFFGYRKVVACIDRTGGRFHGE